MLMKELHIKTGAKPSVGPYPRFMNGRAIYAIDKKYITCRAT